MTRGVEERKRVNIVRTIIVLRIKFSCRGFISETECLHSSQRDKEMAKRDAEQITNDEVNYAWS